MPDKETPDFAWISYSTTLDDAYITVDSQKRLYLSSAAWKKLGLAPEGAALIIGHDHANKRLVVAKPEVVRAVNVRPFRFDPRRYCSAKPFIRALAIADETLPLRYEFLGKDFGAYAEGAYTFGLVGFDAPDGGIKTE
ncbi:hypothetical protein [Peribacillus huizhouensis]|uniref:Uncharacterized protein n=1 Tax=Peribacillus huizhouensis TaxID=1501239 RepID=A0ABR6CR87_9BACI|nr:hypothetical protein [Peribacillus huizhouensis]MBA9027541.1 hypothetical protein [Peribacillus huizhouensis]